MNDIIYVTTIGLMFRGPVKYALLLLTQISRAKFPDKIGIQGLEGIETDSRSNEKIVNQDMTNTMTKKEGIYCNGTPNSADSNGISLY